MMCASDGSWHRFCAPQTLFRCIRKRGGCGGLEGGVSYVDVISRHVNMTVHDMLKPDTPAQPHRQETDHQVEASGAQPEIALDKSVSSNGSISCTPRGQ